MEKRKVQCEDCKFRNKDAKIGEQIIKGALSCYCKKFTNIENPKPNGIVNPKFDFIKDPLDEEGFYIDCPEYAKE